MDPSCLYYVCLISSLHCLIVTWLAVAIETTTSESYENSTVSDNSTFSGTTEVEQTSTGTTLPHKSTVTKEGQNTRVKSVANCMPACPTTTSFHMPACPPPNNLHQLCDVKLGTISCSERATIVRICYNRYTLIYSDSSWDTCVSKDNFCWDIVKFLVEEKLIDADGFSTPSERDFYTEVSTQALEQFSTEVTTEHSQSLSPDITSAKHSKSSNRTDQEMTSAPDISGSVSAVTLTPILSSSSSSSSLPVTDKSSSDDNKFPPLSWIYPLIGCLVILLEIIILWYFFWYRKKKYGSPVGRYRRASTGSMVIQEELIEPESTSPTKALYINKEYNEESAMKEDEKIFNSYLNLRFIDDTSMVGTPERTRRM